MHATIRALVWVAALLAVAPARAASVTETFGAAATVAHGTPLGSCGQLTAALAGKGSITIPGTGKAAVASPAAADAALLYSSKPLPGGGYTVRVEVANINYPKGTQENGVTLLAIANTKPLAATESWWSSFRMLGVEIDVMPGSSNSYPLYINYWDKANLYTWNGTSWGVGGAAWVPVLTFSPTATYSVEIVKASGSYTIRVLSGGATLAKATVTASKVRPATTEYMVTGDRLTNYFSGSMDLLSVTSPGCPPAPDLGIAHDGAADGTGPLDLGSVDTTPPPDDGPAQADGPGADEGGGPVQSWDLAIPELGQRLQRGDGDGCSCAVGRAPHGPPGIAPLAALLLLAGAWRPRRR